MAGYAVLMTTKKIRLRLEFWKPIPAVLYEGRFTKRRYITMIRSRRAVQVLLLTGIIASGAFAAPIPYAISFTTATGAPTPTSGSFTYDSAAALGSQFTAFAVAWDGVAFDFTSPANIEWSGPGDVGPVEDIPFFWDGLAVSAFSDFHLRGNFQFEQNETPDGDDDVTIASQAGGSSNSANASGTFIVIAQTPESSSFILVLAGGALLLLKRIVPGHPEVNG
jgi:hypothetical protein